MTDPLLEVRGLRTTFPSEDGPLPAVDGVTFDLAPGEVLGIVGESGSGKSVTALSLLRLLPPSARITAERLRFAGRDLLAMPERDMQRLRGADISMIFQEPATALNPVFTVGEQIVETLVAHERVDRQAARKRALELLDLVGIGARERRIDEYPHQMSGGMRQRVMIAIALACHPKLLIADEPTTALDVTIQAQILDLLRRLQEQFHMAVILISHDLGVVAEFVDRVIVMYAGKVVENGPVEGVFDRPGHPYTESLLESIPALDDDRERLAVIPGMVPSLADLPPGCRFGPRCRDRRPSCAEAEPPMMTLGRDHHAACIKHQGYRHAAR